MVNTDRLVLDLAEIQGYLHRWPLHPRERRRWEDALINAQLVIEAGQRFAVTVEAAGRDGEDVPAHRTPGAENNQKGQTT